MEEWQVFRSYECAERACFLAALQLAAEVPHLLAAESYLNEAVAHLYERTEPPPCARS